MRKIKMRQFSGVPTREPRPYEAPHAALARRAAAEGVVLLKNDGQLLPLERGSRIALFGAGASRTIKGGTGSGDVNERDSVSIFQGLADAGFEVTTSAWVEDFEQRYAKARLVWREAIRKDIHDNGVPFFVAYAAHPFTMPAGMPAYATDTDTAIYVISRVAGEGADRHASEGDYYLSKQEHELLRQICSLYTRVTVLINTGGVVDLSFLDEFSAIRAALVVSQPGMEGGHAIADVLTGSITPSGKLTDTWAYDYKDYPNSATFSHNSGSVFSKIYEEGIYVGYRYFDSFNVPVRYGFGYGMSYTNFTIRVEQTCIADDGTVTLILHVANIGKVCGKEVVQVYAALPDGRLEKEARRLTAFAKTKLLSPGENQRMMLAFGSEAIASYDEENACWLLEAGVYGIYVGASLQESRLTAALTLAQDKVLMKTEHICPLQQELRPLSCPAEKRAARYAALRQAAEQVPCLVYDLSDVPTRRVDYTLREPEDEASALVDSLTDDQLVQLATGAFSMAQDATLGSSGILVPGSAAQTSSCATAQGVASMVLADGPAGLRLTQTVLVKDGMPQAMPFEMSIEKGFLYDGSLPEGETYYQFCTAIPVGTMLAQTWNASLMEELGSMIGEEMEIFGVQLWLAPGMNIHRNPLCGRNYEYFAEDPLLSGRCAAAITRGVQCHPGIGTTIKHFACNNQEDNRRKSNSILTERTLREIYLRGFEIAIRESAPLSMMTSYNLINGVHTSTSYDLCTRTARCEFGFDGFIMSDWSTTFDEGCSAPAFIRAGNDSVMPGIPKDHDDLRKALADGTLMIEELKRSISRLIRVTLKSSHYK